MVPVLQNLAELLNALGDRSNTEPLYIRLLQIAEKSHGPDHPEVAEALDDLAGFYAETQNYGKAYPLLIRALKIKEMAVGPDHLQVAEIVTKLALMYRGLDDYKKAEPLMVRAQV